MAHDPPSDWKILPLREACGLHARRPTPFDGTRPYLATADVEGGRPVPSESVTFAKRPARADLLLVANDVLQAKMKATNKAFLVSATEDGWLASTGFAQFVPLSVGATPSFVRQFAASSRFLREKDARCVGSTQQAISDSELGAIVIVLPSVDEQSTIAAVLDAVDGVIGKSEQSLAKLKQVKQGLLLDLLTRGIDDDGELRDPERHPSRFKDSPLARIPCHWLLKRLGELSPRLAGRLIVQPHQYFAEQGVPIVFGTNIGPGSILSDGIKRISNEADARFAHCRVRVGDLLTVRVGVPGMTAVVPPELDGCHFASAMWIRGADTFASEWLCCCMNSSLVRRQIESANYGSVQTQFNIREAASFVLPLPPLSEQRAIVERLHAFDKRVASEESALQKLRLAKLGLNEDLLTGRVRVTSLENVVP